MLPKFPQNYVSNKLMVAMSEYYNIFYRFFKTQTLCDVTLLCDDDEQISAHKVILASASPVFLAMFDGRFKENKEINIPIKDIESDILKSIVNCAYTFEMDIQGNNIEKLLKASDYFQFNYAKDLCYDYVKKNINVTNCIHFMRFTESISQKGLYTYSFLYCLENFRTIMESESQLQEIYEFTFADVVEIIKNDHLLVEFEEKLFDIIIEWIKYDYEERCKYLSNLLKYLRLPLISKTALLRICDAPLLKSQNDCLIDLMKNYLSHDVDENITKATIRTPNLYKPNIIFAIKGQSNDSDSYVMYMDLRREEDLNWKSCDCSFFCPPRKGATLVVSDTGVLLAIGGINMFGKMTNCVDELDLTSTSKKWMPTTPLRKIRSFFSVCTRGKFVYVVGGQDPLGPELNSIEYYDTFSKVWYEIKKPMPTARAYCSSIIHDSCLYVFGGSNQEESSTLNCYNLQEKIWTALKEIPIATDLISITSKGDCLYLFGGWPFSISKCAYEFNLKDLKWNKLPDMINAKIYANAVTIGNDLFVVGKNRSSVFRKIKEAPDGVFCEKYISEKNTWQEINSSNIL